MFSAGDIAVIFCNIEFIYKFHKKFYRELKEEISRNTMRNSQVGQLFIAHVRMYGLFWKTHNWNEAVGLFISFL